ncbi:D-cysteine desulfhydrase family protein [Gudongella sp. SC589]|jgi:D-cysteine desulfhydrase|uniref:D-cysteine desulfhydrase family protein n=1 Tax=Gudongella sp. SC589 TaxID=3385990 RepID=UPI003904BBC3
MKMPERIRLANLPTKIEKLERLSQELGKNIWIKRDDQTGMEVSGNKVRKLEFAAKEALDRGCNHLITCGGIQSNHARATAAVAAKLGMGCTLVLRGEDKEDREGNLFLETLMGAQVVFVTPEEFENSLDEIMEGLKAQIDLDGKKGYILPIGASNGIGSFGYLNAYNEIAAQEKELGFKFDAIVATVGSGGTFAGLYAGNRMDGGMRDVLGINISSTAEYFRERVVELLKEMKGYMEIPFEIEKEDINIIDGYPGLGYALSRDEELQFIKWLARLEGLVLDPVYTGKAMYGLVQEIKAGNLDKYGNILFIHTGGIFGWTREVRGRI